MIEREKPDISEPEDDYDDTARERDEEGWTRHDDDEREPDPYQEHLRSEEAQFAREYNRRLMN